MAGAADRRYKPHRHPARTRPAPPTRLRPTDWFPISLRKSRR